MIDLEPVGATVIPENVHTRASTAHNFCDAHI